MSDCWIWTGDKNGNGYGRVRGHRTGLAHRLVYVAVVGPVPEGLELDHLCRTKACVNPEHLEPVTRRENVRRASAYRTKRGQVYQRSGLWGFRYQWSTADGTRMSESGSGFATEAGARSALEHVVAVYGVAA